MAPEMLALGVVELILTFALVLILLTPTSVSFKSESVQFALMCSVIVCFTAFVIGLYRPQMFERARSLLFNTVLSALLSFPVIWLACKALGLSNYWPVGYDALRPLKIIFIWSLAVLFVRLIFLTAARFNLFLHRVAVIGAVDAPSVRAAIRAGRKGFLDISVVEPTSASPELLANSGMQTIVVSSENEDIFAPEALKTFTKRGIKVQAEADFWEHHLRRIDISNLGDLPYAQLSARTLSKWSSIISRLFDICVSLGLLVATLPIMAIVAIIVRIDSPGSILYHQERVGLNNKAFTLLKFRSMRADAEASGPRWAQQKDPRVTRVGLFMRKTRIDELPQLLNILRGEMSFIGPRPERPHFVEQLAKVIPHYHERSRVKPGLTGWAQVNYPYGASVDDARAKLSYDLYYVKNRTILLDLLILLSTVRVILLQEGAR